MNTPTPEQVHAALRVADGLETTEDRRIVQPSKLMAYSDTDALRILAEHIRAVHAECMGEIDRSNDEYECGYTAACRHYAERLIPQEGGAK